MRDSLHATHVMHTWLICFRKKKKTACDLCRDPLQLISASETGVARTRTHARGLTKAWEESDEGLC